MRSMQEAAQAAFSQPLQGTSIDGIPAPRKLSQCSRQWPTQKAVAADQCGAALV